MKATFFTALALSALAVAAPAPTKPDCDKGTWKKGELKGDHGKEWPHKDYFTSYFKVVAKPEEVINMNNGSAPGEPGAIGYYKLGLNSKDNVICYDVVHKKVTGPYSSPAKTATHIHQARKGFAGPPRIAIPNPVGDYHYRRSKGCLQGPFSTGINVTGSNPPVDTGANFHVSQIEADPSNFFADAHTQMYLPGVFRGQLAY